MPTTYLIRKVSLSHHASYAPKLSKTQLTCVIFGVKYSADALIVQMWQFNEIKYYGTLLLLPGLIILKDSGIKRHWRN